MSSRVGRPLKNKGRRVPITVHLATNMLDVIDEYVRQRDEEQERQYSRSDFYNEAADFYLKAINAVPPNCQLVDLPAAMIEVIEDFMKNGAPTKEEIEAEDREKEQSE